MTPQQSETLIDSHPEPEEDLQELVFSSLTPEEAAQLDDRIYLLGVHADRHRVL